MWHTATCARIHPTSAGVECFVRGVLRATSLPAHKDPLLTGGAPSSGEGGDTPYAMHTLVEQDGGGAGSARVSHAKTEDRQGWGGGREATWAIFHINLALA